ncbi:putative xylogalacturonan beta-1,3-xylosyltransferase [Rosa chinensis]|uniref:Putative xylogalacturonan beta-1,3-xylosyltransferase n=1 Tax=Rosa chinensis TaxID=74649 RepID=A0A2P6P2N8_ROSCH|nr:probable arabinosyltransferase ARAD2 [Rosa chinensis]XP_024173097.1 probable arabinosyltransferase ARAD2 [Rosa chinensis]XP_040367870.1 probable arabinosyltransferase ARAD2 [Rosa chinensis]PRQ16181.1 putative xylogalacturonan beta-1,3-xylosyltransferase [Rosa chinensis]
MSSMSEKSRIPSRFISSLITVSVFLLVLSSVFLLQSGNTSFIPRSVFELMLVNGTSVYFEPHVKKEPFKLPFLSSEVPQVDAIKPLKRISESACQVSDSSKKVESVERKKMMICDSKQARLRVFMYELPPEFHFGLLGWKGMENQTWPQHIPPYPGGLNLQHSIEYWLTLDLLSSDNLNVVRPCTVVRVHNSSEADFIFVPFFSSLSYNRHSKLHEKEKVSVNKRLQDKLVQFLMGRNEWKRKGGKDHLIVAHHPNSMLDARKKLGSAMFVLADFGRYPAEIANLGKDIIAPYRHLVTTVPSSKSATFKERPILVYFRGAIYRKDGGVIRQELYHLLKDEKDVDFTFGSIGGNGVRKATQGMASSKFCLNIAGDTPSSNRLFDAIASHCVPVIISDEIELPFEDVLDYSQFCIFVRGADAVKKGYLLKLLRGINKDKWTKMWERLKEVVHHFEYQYPSLPDDAVDMIWQAVSRKISSLQFKYHRKKRYDRSQLV